MTDGRTVAYRSPDNRCRTAYYEGNGGNFFCVSEKTLRGALVTEFAESGRLVDQVYYRGKAAEEALEGHLGHAVEIVPVQEYQRVSVSAECSKCHKSKIGRELDFANLSGVDEVPVVPTFRCVACGQRFYAMSDEYLSSLVERNIGLFEKEELEERRKDGRLFVNTLNEYIIRIFASKKISRLVVKE